MKRLAFLFLIILSGTAFSQELTFAQIDAAVERPKGDFTSYVAKNGQVFKVGEKIKIGQPSNKLFFNFVQSGDGIATPIEKAGSSASGDEVEIKRIEIWGTKRTGFFAAIRTKGGWVGYGIDLENAIEAGEVVTTVMSSDQALAELKKAKDKLDLGLITQSQFDSLKIELAKIIK